MQKNKHLVKSLAASALVLGLVSIATTDANAAAVNGGISVTRHNLGTSNRTGYNTSNLLGGKTAPGAAIWNSTSMTGVVNAGNKYTNATDEICVFCHTPHGSNVTGTAGVNAPLWNRLAGTLTYNMYASGSMQGTAAQLAGSGSMSLACLSCHDGTQAMDAMINKPGSSGFSQPGSKDYGSFRMSGNGTLGFSSTAFDDSTATIGSAGTGTNWSPVVLGTDLSNDHPINMPYCGGGQTSLNDNSTCSDTDFNALSASAPNGGSFYVGGGSQKEQMRVYGASAAVATVECGSCHDPHSAVNRTFLRTSNAGSAVCLTCHAK